MENRQFILVGEIDDKPFRERLDEELKRFGKTNKEWAALTGIPEQTIINVRSVGRKATLRAEYLWAFWKEYPDLDVHFIVTGEKTDKTSQAITELDKAAQHLQAAKKLL